MTQTWVSIYTGLHEYIGQTGDVFCLEVEYALIGPQFALRKQSPLYPTSIQCIQIVQHDILSQKSIFLVMNIYIHVYLYFVLIKVDYDFFS